MSMDLATEILPAGADRNDWLRARGGGIGGSDALAVLGLSPWCGPYELWLEKTGRIAPAPDSAVMKWGRRMEPVAADWFAEDTGLSVERAGTWVRRDNPVWRCNPDGFVSDGGGLEIKTTSPLSGQAKLWRTGVPDYPEGQAQYCMGVTGLPHWWIACFIWGQDPYVHRVERDEDIIGELFGAADDFWRQHVEADVPPPVDGLKSTGEAIARAMTADGGVVELGPELEEWLAQRAVLKGRAKGVKTELDEVENRIKAALLAAGAATGLVQGRPRVAFRSRSRAGYSVAPTTYRELRELTR